MSGSECRVTLVTSNGWGLGHLSRQLSVALALGAEADVTIFSMSRGVGLLGDFGIRGEYCPDKDSQWIVDTEWSLYVRDRFDAYLKETSPEVVLFDGVAPYLGILRALRWHPDVIVGWLRRGMWRKGIIDAQLKKTDWFDFVIEPGDIAAEADTGPTAELDAIRTPPISLLDVIEPYPREEASLRLGLDPDRPALLVTLGSGQPGDSSEAAVSAIDVALEKDGWQVAVARSPIAPPGSGRPRDGTIQLPGVYPLAAYLPAFDAAIGAAGYNGVHEWLSPAGPPSLLVPKSASQADDQVARAGYLAEQGLVLMADDDSPADVAAQTHRLLNDKVRSDLAAERARLHVASRFGGAQAVAEVLRDPPPPLAANRPSFGARERLKAILGPTVVGTIRHLRGRSPQRLAKTPVSMADDSHQDAMPVTMTTDVRRIQIDADGPVEHLLEGSSDSYREARTRIVNDYYRLVD